MDSLHKISRKAAKIRKVAVTIPCAAAKIIARKGMNNRQVAMLCVT